MKITKEKYEHIKEWLEEIINYDCIVDYGGGADGSLAELTLKIIEDAYENNKKNT